QRAQVRDLLAPQKEEGTEKIEESRELWVLGFGALIADTTSRYDKKDVLTTTQKQTILVGHVYNMSVLFETSLGDLVIDLEVDACPKTCENFLKLCKIYYYNLNAFFNVSKDFLAQAGDPTASGTGGQSIWSLLDPSKARYFTPEFRPKLKHTRKGTVSMAVAPEVEGSAQGGCGSQFFVTLADDIDYLDGKHCVFGHVVEGLETLDKLNDVFTDKDGRPFKDVRIRHVLILGIVIWLNQLELTKLISDDPFTDPTELGRIQPPSSPIRPPDNSNRIAEDEDPLETLPEEEEERIRREKAAAASALTLELVGDLPFANVRPPENVLFVCKLNPVTRDEDLELIFSRFGTIMSCQVIRDKRTGDSLQYAFIEFDKREEAEQASFRAFPGNLSNGYSGVLQNAERPGRRSTYLGGLVAPNLSHEPTLHGPTISNVLLEAKLVEALPVEMIWNAHRNTGTRTGTIEVAVATISSSICPNLVRNDGHIVVIVNAFAGHDLLRGATKMNADEVK
ncbi:unnamed protein product, partial [Mycena citricolor]